MHMILNEIQRLNEDDLREKIIIPLLCALGCSNVSNTHGSKEWGKDVLYKRGHFLKKEIWGGVVIKKNSINITKKILGEVHVQVLQAADKFVNPKDPTAMIQLHEILLITSGEITVDAKQFICNNGGKNFPNIHFVDGDQLEKLIKGIITQYNEDNSKFNKKFDFDKFTPDKFKITFAAEYNINKSNEGGAIE